MGFRFNPFLKTALHQILNNIQFWFSYLEGGHPNENLTFEQKLHKRLFNSTYYSTDLLPRTSHSAAIDVSFGFELVKIVEVVSFIYHHIFLHLACLIRTPETIIVHGQFPGVKIRFSWRPEHLTRNLKIFLEISTLFNMNFHPGNMNLKKKSFFFSLWRRTSDRSVSFVLYLRLLWALGRWAITWYKTAKLESKWPTGTS